MSNEDVGYKKPPKNKQFKKGQSGNIKGRPKKKGKPVYELLEVELGKTVEVKENNAICQITKIEVAVKALVHNAMAGDVRSFKIIEGLMNKSDESKQSNNGLDRLDFTVLKDSIKDFST